MASGKITVIPYTEPRVPLWYEEDFRRLYAAFLESLPALMRSTGIDVDAVEEVPVELHPGFPKAGVRGRLQDETVTIKRRIHHM